MNYLNAISKFEIVDKEGKSVSFIPNEPQKVFYNSLTGKDIILKSRQLGFSSLILAMFTIDFLLKENSRSVCISHDAPSAQKLLDRVKYFLDSAQKKGLNLNLKYNSRNEMVNSDKNSTFYLGQAGSKTFGRGDTLTNLHLSEFAFYEDPERLLASVLQALVPTGRAIIETTPNGINFFKSFWDRSKAGETGFKTHFFANNFYSGEFLNQKKKELGERLFRQEYPSNDAECFLTSGDPFFDMDKLQLYLSRATDSLRVGSFVGLNPVAFEESSNGLWRIWELPKEGHNYILAADVAETRDYCAACVLDRKTFSIVATFHGHLEAILFGNELSMAGKYYNTSLIAVEKNNHGLAVIQRLRELYYPSLYQRKVIDSVTQTEASDIGWLTNIKTRPLMLSTLQSAINQTSLHISDAETIKEMMSFVRNDKGKPEATYGSFDDRVIALAIAVEIYSTSPAQNSDDFDLAAWEFENQKEREMLNRRWGGI